LEAFVGSVAEVHVPQEVENHCDAVLRGEEFSSDLLTTVERIRATLNAGLEKGSVVFSTRRMSRRDDAADDDEEDGTNFPTMDILSNLSDMDAIAADDRFLNKEAVWADGNHRIPCVSTLEIILALNNRGIISEAQKYTFLHRLREGGYHSIPTDGSELLGELNRSTIEGEKLVETRELTAIRTNLTIALRSRMHTALETPWVDYTRAVIFQTLRNLWTENSPATSIIPRADWLLAVLPSPIRLLNSPSDEALWETAAQKTGAVIGLMLSPPFTSKERQIEYAGVIDARLTGEIFRLLESSNEQLARLKTADQVLRCCSYIAAITHDGELSKAVVARCLRLISPQTKPDAVLRLLLISMRASGAYRDAASYYREVATIATRYAYAVPIGSALEMRKVLEVMKCRDPRLAASFGRAEAILEAAILAV
jgi:hypothetical protein